VRIAIFGLHAGTQASFRPEEWNEVWRMAHDPEAPQAHRIFEAHSEPIARKYGGDAYIAKLAEYAADGMLTTLWPYPFAGEEAAGSFTGPRNGMTQPQSSVAFMFAVALDNPENEAIGLFGVDMSDGEEYGYQRPNMCYLIGAARGHGVPVHIDPASSLLKSQWTAGIYGHPDNINDMVYRLT
jgi:hypothetical protein